MEEMENRLEGDETQKKDLKILRMLQVPHSKNLYSRIYHEQKIEQPGILFCLKGLKQLH